MPNWCANLLEVNGSVEAKQAFLDAVTGEETSTTALSLAKLKPLPDGKWDYDWCNANWGTKWDIDADLVNPGWAANDDNLRIVFDSAWGPPDVAFQVLPEMFPDLVFMHMFAEPGMDFSGSDTYIGTNRDDDHDWNFEYPSPSSMVAGYIWNLR